VVATANDITSIVNNAPELLRKGRFDELFFVDLPNEVERVEILEATLRQYKRALPCQSLVNDTAGFTGAELASIVPEALFTAFADGARDLKVTDLFLAAKQVVPLSKTAKDKIAAMRAWAVEKARPATTPLVRGDAKLEARVLDL
jgi:SpoVK/Ycf46/Vps4 family AAA+-type ATPase